MVKTPQRKGGDSERGPSRHIAKQNMRELYQTAVLELLILSGVTAVRISVDPVTECGKSLPTCPNKIGLKVVGGRSSCAEKVPWNVLIVRRDRRKKRQSSGNLIIVWT